MLYQSRWAPPQGSAKLSSSMKSTDNSGHPEASSSSSTATQQTEPTPLSDPALRLIDQEANRMDVDPQASAGGPSGGTSEAITQISLVIDTNVLLRYLEVLQQFAEDAERERAPISIVIPGVVVEELDYQKTDKNRQLCWAARMASTWILSKLKERRIVRGQAYQETLQSSGSWKKREPGTTNDDLIVDCCLFLREKKHQNILAISQDNNFCTTAEAQGISTLNPKAFIRWSSRSFARFLFGDHYPRLDSFADYKETFRHRRVREALEDELGEQGVKSETVMDDDMEIDEDCLISRDPPPQHLLDDLHDQVLAHFGIHLSELLQRVAPSSLFTEAPLKSGATSSIYASPTTSKPAKDWTANEILSYLCNPRRVLRTASAADVKVLMSGSSRMIDFFTHKYYARGRSGQYWARADWVSCMDTLGALGRVYGEDAIANSLEQLTPQMDLVFASPMRPTGTGSF